MNEYYVKSKCCDATIRTWVGGRNICNNCGKECFLRISPNLPVNFVEDQRKLAQREIVQAILEKGKTKNGNVSIDEIGDIAREFGNLGYHYYEITL